MGEESDNPIVGTEENAVLDKTSAEINTEESEAVSISPEEKASILSRLLSEKEYEEIFRKAVRVCKSKGLSQKEAEDIAQETIIIALYENPPPPEAELIKWVHGILRNKILRALERRNKFKKIDDYRESETFSSSSKQLDWDEKKLLVILDKCFNQCLDNLDEQKHNLFIEYKYIEGKQDSELRQEIARRLGIEDGTLRRRINIIMEKFAVCLEKCYQKDESASKWKNHVTKENLKSYINQKFENE